MKNIFARTKVYIVFLLAAMTALAWMLYWGSRPVSAISSPVRIGIAHGTSAAMIAQVLKERDLIRSVFIFRLTCQLSSASSALKPGVYELNRNMSMPEIIDVMVRGKTLETKVTIPEGYTIRQIADLMDSSQLAECKPFVAIALNQGYDFAGYSFLDGDNLEGYLFPDTYLIARGSSSEKIVKKMLDAFQQKVVVQLRPDIEETIRDRFGMNESSFAEGLHRILTLASLVEREAKIDKDRPLVAAVMWNRLVKNMRLEIDATVTYVPGQSTNNKPKVLYSDLENDSPYNTYRRAGLPPAPICNPGLKSIEAVLHPAKVDYLYYVARKDGSHVFSRTLKEHTIAKNAMRSSGI